MFPDNGKGSASVEQTYQGATVIDPVTGYHKPPTIVCDFVSLYPSIMVAYNLSFETWLMGGLKDVARLKLARDQMHEVDLGNHTVYFLKSLATDPPPASQLGVGRLSTHHYGLLPRLLIGLLEARRAVKRQLSLCPPEQTARRKVLHAKQLAIKRTLPL